MTIWIYKSLRNLAKNHPVIFFIVTTYLWSWSFWIPIHQDGLPPGMTLALTLMGVFGPALAGSLVLRLREEPKEASSLPWAGFLTGALLAVSAIAMFKVNLLGVTDLAPKADLNFPPESPWYVYVLMGLVVAISGFIFTNVQSSYPTVRSFYEGLVPNRRTFLLAIPVLLFLPTVLILASTVADLLGISYEQPKYLQQSVAVWLPLMFVKLFTVAILTGGNEEHGWRGVLLPLLQKKWSPLVATLIIGLVWEPWHLPIVLDFIEDKTNIGLIVMARLVAIMPIAFLMTILYNYSRGSIFLCVLLHACFNTQLKLFVGSELMALVLLITILVSIVFFKMWRRNTGYVPTQH